MGDEEHPDQPILDLLRQTVEVYCYEHVGLGLEDTSFTLDILGRCSANALAEALDSAVPGRKFADARPFDHIVIGGGSFGAVLATRLFNSSI